jgi:hypothetical protein
MFKSIEARTKRILESAITNCVPPGCRLRNEYTLGQLLYPGIGAPFGGQHADCGMNPGSTNSPEPASAGIRDGPSWLTVVGKYARRREWLTWPAHPYPLNSARIQCGRLQTNCRSGVLTARREVGNVSSPVRKTLPCLATMTVAQAAGLGFRIACRGVAGGRRFPA